MEDLYMKIFEAIKQELEESASEIFVIPIPFTVRNRIAMLAATVAVKIIEEEKRDK